MGVKRTVCRICADSEPRLEAVRQARGEEVRAAGGKIGEFASGGVQDRRRRYGSEPFCFFSLSCGAVLDRTFNRVSGRAQGSQAQEASPVLPVSALDVSSVCEKSGKREDEAAKERGR